MTDTQYQKEALRTYNKFMSKDINMQLVEAALGLAGEAGEVVDEVKKVSFQGHELNRVSIMEELGDVYWYLALACDALGITIDKVKQYNINKLRQRYPQGFETERSVNR